MIAMLVEIDGERVVLAGADDWSILALHVNASRGRDNPSDPEVKDDIEFSVGGLTEPDMDKMRYHFRWPRRELQVGSAVTVTIVSVDKCDPATKRYRSDAEVQECPYTDEEMREFRRKDYLELKKEFGGDEDA